MNNFLVFLLRYLFPRREWYRRFYLRSNHWRNVRKQKLQSTNGRCELCGGLARDVHHKVYHLWTEKLRHLTAVCRQCHEDLHAR